MKIVVNTRLLIKDKLEGIGRFSYETLKRLVQLRPQDEFIFLFDRDYDKEFIFGDNVRAIVKGPKVRHPLLYKYWFSYAVGKVLRKENPDLFLSMDGLLCLRTLVKQIPVIHDLNFEHYPQFLPLAARKYYRYYFPKFAKRAARIITVSNFSKQDIVDRYGINENIIDVSCNAADDVFQPLPDEEINKVKKQYTESCDYFVYVGSINPRKNLKGVVRAYDKFREVSTDNVKLVIAGEIMWNKGQLKEILHKSSHSKDIVCLGRLNDQELSRVIASSVGLCYVSYFEGFGIPILEGMKCGVPVITSNVTSMPEVAGDAAILVDPDNHNDIARAMNILISDKEQVKRMVENGLERVKQYSWDKAAQVLNDSINKLA